jgi:hypothetical protein
MQSSPAALLFLASFMAVAASTLVKCMKWVIAELLVLVIFGNSLRFRIVQSVVAMFLCEWCWDIEDIRNHERNWNPGLQYRQRSVAETL